MKKIKQIFNNLDKMYPDKFMIHNPPNKIYTRTYAHNKPIRRKWNISWHGQNFIALSDNSLDPKITADTIEQLITKIQLIDP